MNFNKSGDKVGAYRDAIYAFLGDTTIAGIRENPTSENGLCMAILCHLTPDQLRQEISESTMGGKTSVLKWMESRNTYLHLMTTKCFSYYGSLIAEVFYESKLVNYQLLINELERTRCQSLETVFNLTDEFYEKNYLFIKKISPKLILLIERYMASGLGAGWNKNWTNVIYSHMKMTPGNEKFAEYEKLPASFSEATGLDICVNQSFGVELEITTTRSVRIEKHGEKLWENVAKQLIACLNSAVGVDKVYQSSLAYHEDMYDENDNKLRKHSLWKVEADGSVGWEIVSPILKGLEGVSELKRVLDDINVVLSEHDFLCINHRCGLHLNLETPITKNIEWKSFLTKYIRIEPSLFPLMAPARIFKYCYSDFSYDKYEYNPYCMPISLSNEEIVRKMELDIESGNYKDEKHTSINIKRCGSAQGDHNSINMLEVRIHNGTSSSLAVISWLALWMKIINHFELHQENLVPNNYDFIDSINADEEDLFKILEDEGIVMDKKLAKLLHNRRKAMRYLWSIAFAEKVALWVAADFYE